MTSPGGSEVGRVSIRAVPNTSQFGSDLKTDLERIEETTSIELPVKFKIDYVQLREELATLQVSAIEVPIHFNAESLTDDLAKVQAQAAKTAVSVPIEFKARSLRLALTEVRKAAKTMPVIVPIDFTAKSIATALRKVQADIKAAGQSVKVPIEFNPKNLNTALKPVRAAAKQTSVIIPIEFNPKSLKAALAPIRAAAKTMAVTVPIEFNARSIRTALANTRAIARTIPIVVPIEFSATSIRNALAATRTIAAGIPVRVPIEFGPIQALGTATAAIRAQARATPLRVPIEFGPIQALGTALAAVRAQAAANGITVPVSFNVGNLRTALRTATAGVGNLTVNVEADAIVLIRSIRRAVGLVGPLTVRVNADVDTDNIRRQVERSLNGIGGGGGGIGGGGAGLLGGGAFRFIRLLGDLIKFTAIAATLPAIGAAISAAWGAASTAVTALPAAIGLFAAPAAAVALGLDGIKAALEPLTADFEKLSTKIDEVFSRRLAPLVEKFRNTLFPVIETGLIQVANGVSSLAESFGDIFLLIGGDRTLKTFFENVSTSVAGLGAPLALIADSFLRIAGNKDALDALTTTISQIGKTWRESLDQLEDTGALERAFDGLSGVLREAAQGIGAFLTNGVELFAAAAPGIEEFLDKLTDFFNKFDYERLGTAVGNVFSGIAEALEKVKPETIEAITVSFEKIGETFQDPAFQDNIVSFIESLPALIDILRRLMESFAEAGPIIKSFLDFVRDVDQFFRNDLPGFQLGFTAGIDLGMTAIGEFGGKISEFLFGPLTDYDEEMSKPNPAELWAQALPLVLEKLGELGQGFVDFITNPFKVFTDGFNGLPEKVAAGTDGMAPAAQPGMESLSQVIVGKLFEILNNLDILLGEVGEAVAGAFNLLPSQAQPGLDQSSANFGTWGTGLLTIAQTAMANVASSIIAGGTTIVSNLTQIGARIVATFAGLPQQFLQIGINLMNSLAQGIISAATAAASAAINAVIAVVNAAKRAAGIDSPSKKFIEIGEFMGEGLAVGLDSMTKEVEKAGRNLVSASVDAARAAGASLDDAASSMKAWDAVIGSGSKSVDGDVRGGGASNSGPLIGTLSVTAPEGASARQVVDEALFALRHVRRGVYGGRR